MSTRRMALKVLCTGVTVASAPSFLRAQDAWPSRPIKLLASSAPGSPTDVISRLVATGLSKRLGQTVYVEAKPGAAGQIAAAEIARSKPDGYSFVSIFGSYAVNATLSPAKTYQESDLTGVAIYGTFPGMTAAHPSLPRGLAAIVAHAKSHPGAISYASGGIGTLSHLKMEMLAEEAGISLNHVPYKAGASALPDLIAGRVQLMVEGISLLKPLCERGQLTAVGVDSAVRHPAIPEVPTFVEQGFPGQIHDSWNGMVAHSATPGPIITRMSEVVNEVLNSEEVKRTLSGEAFGMDVKRFTPEQTNAFLAKEMKKWGDIVRRLKLT